MFAWRNETMWSSMMVFLPAIVTGTKNMNAPMPLYTNNFHMWRDAVRGACEVMAKVCLLTAAGPCGPAFCEQIHRTVNHGQEQWTARHSSLG